MALSLFSTYSTSENRITSTILAVFERLNSATVGRILQVFMEDSTIELIVYENQIKEQDSIPDGRIKGNFDYVIETKIVPNSVNKSQIINHCKSLNYDYSKLLVLTPDFSCPKTLMELDKEYTDKIVWGNFDKIIEAINTVLEESILLLDREKFLLLELKEFIINERLTSEDYSRKALIIPAGTAWDFYKKYALYKCQANRSFQQSSYMGFYYHGKIQQYFPRILGFVESFNILKDDIDDDKIILVGISNKQEIKNRILKIKGQLLLEAQNESSNIIEREHWNGNYKFIFLSEIESTETFVNDWVISNDKTSYSEKGTAFVQKQTYLNIDKLKGKRYTSEL